MKTQIERKISEIEKALSIETSKYKAKLKGEIAVTARHIVQNSHSRKQQALWTANSIQAFRKFQFCRGCCRCGTWYIYAELWNETGRLPVNLLHEEKRYVIDRDIPAYQPRTCAACGKELKPMDGYRSPEMVWYCDYNEYHAEIE